MGLFSKNKKDEPPREEGVFNKFLEAYKPPNDLRKPTKEMLDFYADKLPQELLDFWVDYGFGNYANGLIKVIEPSDYMDSFYTWTGEEDHSKLPILVTAFGDVFYYRKLSDSEEDVCLLNIHYRKIEVCEYSLLDFFQNYIVNEALSQDLLKKQLFSQAMKNLGQLSEDEIYFFSPALILGGAEDIKYIDKGDGNVHQLILHQLGS